MPKENDISVDELQHDEKFGCVEISEFVFAVKLHFKKF